MISSERWAYAGVQLTRTYLDELPPTLLCGRHHLEYVVAVQEHDEWTKALPDGKKVRSVTNC
jgi:hypothetical protein